MSTFSAPFSAQAFARAHPWVVEMDKSAPCQAQKSPRSRVDLTRDRSCRRRGPWRFCGPDHAWGEVLVELNLCWQHLMCHYLYEEWQDALAQDAHSA